MQKSIIQDNKEICFVCKRYIYGKIDPHHIFNGSANRKKSDEDKMIIYTHRICHEQIHNNEKLDLKIKAFAQNKWQEYYRKSREDFIKRYGISYIDKYEIKRSENEHTN